MTILVIHIQPLEDSSSKQTNPLNPLSKPTRKHLKSSLSKAIHDSNITSIILFGGQNFSAGADIGEFSAKNNIESSEEIPSLSDLCNIIESSPKPIIAAITGVALGGGFELALSCHFRIAHVKSRFGLPEVNIGLIPGAGGTQRLPRLCKNIAWTLDVITSGRMISASEAKCHNIIDCIIDKTKNNDDFLIQCEKWALYSENYLNYLKLRTASSQRVILNNDKKQLDSAHKICNDTLKKLPPENSGGRAKHSAVKAIRASFEKPTFEQGMEVEGEIFWDLLLNCTQGRALRHAFFAERLAQKPIAVPSSQQPTNNPIRQLLLNQPSTTHIGVIGAGTMGSGIAVSFLRAGYKVVLVDNNEKGLHRAKQIISSIFQQDVVRNRLSNEQASNIIQHQITFNTEIKSFAIAQCLLVVEAVFENLKIKQSIFRELDQVVSNPHALLLTNTSTLDVDVIASSLKPERRPYFAGMHFFSPAHLMKLVEIIQSSHSSPETLSLIQTITTRMLRKVGVTVGNCHGFVGNRMLFPYTSEAVFLLQEGVATVVNVDTALTNFGMAVGPLAVGDIAGNDIGYLVRKEQGLVKDPQTGEPGPNRKKGMRYSDMADELVSKLGRVGQKALKGWYDYDIKVGKGRKPIVSQEVTEFIAQYSSKNESTSHFSEQQIVERVLFPLVNEGFKILEEDIARRPSDIDIIYLYGYGWPAWRGGPMYWADNQVGLKYMLDRLKVFHQSFPGSNHYIPSALLEKCVELNLTLQEFYDKGLNKRKESNRARL